MGNTVTTNYGEGTMNTSGRGNITTTTTTTTPLPATTTPTPTTHTINNSGNITFTGGDSNVGPAAPESSKRKYLILAAAAIGFVTSIIGLYALILH
jgi:hypothetical protein